MKKVGGINRVIEGEDAFIKINKDKNFIETNIVNNIKKGDLKQSFALFVVECKKMILRWHYHPFYSTHLKLPNSHSSSMLRVTINKKMIMFKIKPFNHITIGVTDIIISSKSRIKKIIQNTKNRRDTGKTLTLNESNPHSKDSVLINFDLRHNLPKIIKLGTIKEIKKYSSISHINNLINK